MEPVSPHSHLPQALLGRPPPWAHLAMSPQPVASTGASPSCCLWAGWSLHLTTPSCHLAAGSESLVRRCRPLRDPQQVRRGKQPYTPQCHSHKQPLFTFTTKCSSQSVWKSFLKRTLIKRLPHAWHWCTAAKKPPTRRSAPRRQTQEQVHRGVGACRAVIHAPGSAG